jgi:hypothetical protein
MALPKVNHCLKRLAPDDKNALTPRQTGVREHDGMKGLYGLEFWSDLIVF